MEKTRYQSDRLPMVLFLACLAITVVAASHSNSKASIDNLYSPIYYGDLQVHEGKQFWITCQAEKPIKWHKDGDPIDFVFVRQGDEEFTYSTRLNERDDLKGKVESTLNVSHAVLRHRGRYQCNTNHESAHVLHVEPTPVSLKDESEKRFHPFDADDDHDDFSPSFEDSLDDDSPAASTMMHSIAATQSTKIFNVDNDDKSHENPSFTDESEDYESEVVQTTMTSTTTTESTSPPISFTNSPIPTTKAHSTHANIQTNNAIHTLPSEVEKQDHLDKHPKGKLEPKFEKAPDGSYIHVYNIAKPTSLICTSSEPEKVVWSKEVNGEKTSVKDVPALSGRYTITPKEHRFMIDKTLETDAGKYACSQGDDSFEVEVIAAVVVKIPQHAYVIEDEKLELPCIVKGSYPKVKWTFRFENETESRPIDNERYTFGSFEEIEGAKLIIEKAELSDRGYFTCRGTNDFMNQTEAISEGYVRVKDKLAALWPFLGICAEVFVLCAIILIYEKRRNKTDLDESDTDQSPDQKNDHNMKDSDVRHRK